MPSRADIQLGQLDRSLVERPGHQQPGPGEYDPADHLVHASSLPVRRPCATSYRVRRRVRIWNGRNDSSTVRPPVTGSGPASDSGRSSRSVAVAVPTAKSAVSRALARPPWDSYSRTTTSPDW